MPTTSKAASATPSKPSTPTGRGGFGPMAAIVKTIAGALGFVATLLSLMACVGAFTANGYARVLVALAVALAVPLVLADRLLPDDPLRAKGLVSDVLALVWLGFAFIFTVPLNQATRGLLTREGDRLVETGWINMARTAYFLAGVQPAIPAPVPRADNTAASGAGPADASVEAADGGAGTGPSADTSADASTSDASGGAPADAGPVPTQKGDKTPAELFKLLSPSVVTIFVKGGGPGAEGGGTGFLLSTDGTIATNHHVIAQMTQIRIKTMSGATFENVELLVDDKAADLALLRVNLASPVDGGPAVEIPPVTLGDSDAIVVGERAVSIGNPLGLEHTLTDGLISSRRFYVGRAWIQMSVPVSPGNSGGPLFNMRGEVIGVTTAQIGGFGRAQNLNLAVPVNDLKKLIRSEYPNRRKFGESSSSQW